MKDRQVMGPKWISATLLDLTQIVMNFDSNPQAIAVEAAGRGSGAGLGEAPVQLASLSLGGTNFALHT